MAERDRPSFNPLPTHSESATEAFDAPTPQDFVLFGDTYFPPKTVLEALEEYGDIQDELQRLYENGFQPIPEEFNLQDLTSDAASSLVQGE